MELNLPPSYIEYLNKVFSEGELHVVSAPKVFNGYFKFFLKYKGDNIIRFEGNMYDSIFFLFYSEKSLLLHMIPLTKEQIVKLIRYYFIKYCTTQLEEIYEPHFKDLANFSSRYYEVRKDARI